MNNNSATTIIVAVLIAGGAFFGGMQYQKNNQTSSRGTQMTGGRNGQTGTQARQGSGQGSRPVSGEILNQDDKSITVKLQDGSTKIIILSDTTTINKASTGSKSDLKTGERITTFGVTNADGSVTAQTISIGGMMMRGGSKETPSPTGK